MLNRPLAKSFESSPEKFSYTSIASRAELVMIVAAASRWSRSAIVGPTNGRPLASRTWPLCAAPTASPRASSPARRWAFAALSSPAFSESRNSASSLCATAALSCRVLAASSRPPTSQSRAAPRRSSRPTHDLLAGRPTSAGPCPPPAALAGLPGPDPRRHVVGTGHGRGHSSCPEAGAACRGHGENPGGRTRSTQSRRRRM